MIDGLLQSVPLPESKAAFTAALVRRFPKAIRLRRDVSPKELPFASGQVPWYRLGRRPHPESPPPTRLLNYPAGDYYVQDAGSLLALAAAVADTEHLQGQLICDLCAAPGGKATALVEAIGATGFVLANETVRSRLAALKLNLARTGSDRWAVSSLDPEQLASQLAGVFDLVLVDAPCSGQALLGRGKANQTAFSVAQITHSAARQRRILAAAVQLVRPGGRLVYSTCTFAEAENEAQIRQLIATSGAEPDPLRQLADYETEPGCYRLWPHLHGCAGAFAAVVRLASQSGSTARESYSSRSLSLPAELNAWYAISAESNRFVRGESTVWGYPADAPAWVEGIAVSGPELAYRVGQTWRPAHGGAMRRDGASLASQVIGLDDAAAAQFLRGETIRCSAQGWVAVGWQGRPLGWVKADGVRGKNHLPKGGRMESL